MPVASKVAADPATRYAADVVAGEIVAGPWVRLACERHLRDMARAEARDSYWPWRWEWDRAEAVGDFFGLLRFYEGPSAGKPFVLEPFQLFIVGSIFAWVHKDTGYRRFLTAYVETGKGSGKTPMAAAIGLWMLMADGEAGAQVYPIATKFDQAMLTFRAANAFASSSPVLSKRLRIDKQNLAYPRTNSFMRPLGSRVAGSSGPLPSCTIADEIHEMQDDELLNIQRRGTKSRTQALIFEITNSGEGQTGIAWEHHQYSVKVVQGVIDDDRWFAYVCALDEGDDWTDPDVWIKANPGLGTILPVDYLARQVKEGVEMMSAQNNVKRLNMCIWTSAKTAWLDMEAWDKGQVARSGFEAMLEREADGRELRCFGGVDLSKSVAMTAFAELWRLPPAEDAAAYLPVETDSEDEGQGFDLRALGRVAARVHFFLPEEGLRDREDRDGVPYSAWAEQGWITLTPGKVVNYEYIRHAITQARNRGRYVPVEVGFDPWNGRDLMTRMLGDGAPVVEVQQSAAYLSDASKQLERLVKAEWFLWEENPVLRWHASNATTTRDVNGNIKPDKSDERAFIDGISAIVNALALLVRDEGAEEEADTDITFFDF